MANEDKILAMLEDIQKKMNVMQTDIDLIKKKKLDDESIANQLVTLEKMRHLLTKEEADAVAAAIGE